MTDEERFRKQLMESKIRVNAIRDYYLSLPGKTEEGWAEVLLNPRKYNHVWRHMLKHACGQCDLAINNFPPPVHLQSLTPGNHP